MADAKPQTQRLRKLLDAAGIDWHIPTSGHGGDHITIFTVGIITWAANESEHDGLYLYVLAYETAMHLTAEQALALVVSK